MQTGLDDLTGNITEAANGILMYISDVHSSCADLRLTTDTMILAGSDHSDTRDEGTSDGKKRKRKRKNKAKKGKKGRREEMKYEELMTTFPYVRPL